MTLATTATWQKNANKQSRKVEAKASAKLQSNLEGEGRGMTVEYNMSTKKNSLAGRQDRRVARI